MTNYQIFKEKVYLDNLDLVKGYMYQCIQYKDLQKRHNRDMTLESFYTRDQFKEHLKDFEVKLKNLRINPTRLRKLAKIVHHLINNNTNKIPSVKLSDLDSMILQKFTQYLSYRKKSNRRVYARIPYLVNIPREYEHKRITSRLKKSYIARKNISYDTKKNETRLY